MVSYKIVVIIVCKCRAIQKKSSCTKYKTHKPTKFVCTRRIFLRFRFGDRKEILRDRLEVFERPFSIDVISGHYILRDRWRNLRDRFGPSKHFFGPSKHLKKNTVYSYHYLSIVGPTVQ